MKKLLTAFTLLALVCTAHAEVFRCRSATGKLQFSDTPCAAGTSSEVVPDRAPVTEQQRAEAQQRARRLDNVADESNQTALAVAPATPPAATGPAPADQKKDADAVAQCVRDVERQPASVKAKGDMIAACQSAGRRQREDARSSDAVHDCVRDIERNGSAGDERARQIALCHDGDVPKERHLYKPSQIN